MNWLKKIWNWLVQRTSTSPKLVLAEKVQEDPRGAGPLFGSMCRAVGVKNRDLNETNAVELFEEWYDGPATEEGIKKALKQFKEAYPRVGPKAAHTERIIAGDYLI